MYLFMQNPIFHRSFLSLYLAYVCMYVCMWVYMYVCMWVYIYVCMYVCTYVSMYICMYVCKYIHMWVCMYVMYVCMYAVFTVTTLYYLLGLRWLWSDHLTLVDDPLRETWRFVLLALCVTTLHNTYTLNIVLYYIVLLCMYALYVCFYLLWMYCST